MLLGLVPKFKYGVTVQNVDVIEELLNITSMKIKSKISIPVLLKHSIFSFVLIVSFHIVNTAWYF